MPIADSPVKTLDHIGISRAGDGIVLEYSAKSFLHKQVRSITGSLVEVGRGKFPADWIAEILAAKDRKACGPVAPPDGLLSGTVCFMKKKRPRTRCEAGSRYRLRAERLPDADALFRRQVHGIAWLQHRNASYQASMFRTTPLTR